MIGSIVFQGLDLLKRVSSPREEAQRLETEGLGKIKAAVAGSEAEGLYGLLMGAISYSSIPPPPKRPCHTPSATISKPSPQEPEEAVAKVSAPVAKVMEQALGVTTPAVSPAPEVAIPTQMTPLHLQLGGIKRVYKCQVEGCTEEPSTSHATICAHVCREHLGVRLACPSHNKTFFNSNTFRHHKKSQLN